MAIDRKAMMDYARLRWCRPCHDGTIYSNIKGTVNVEAARKALKLDSSWDAVIIPAVDPKTNQLIDEKARCCFIRKNASGQEIPVPDKKPTELSGKFDIVPFYQQKGDHDGLEDCAQNVSCVLRSGGVKINHAGVPGLVADLQNGRFSKITRTLGEKVTKKQGDRIMSTGVMDPGDIVAFFDKSYHHSAVYTGIDHSRVHRITCHTRSRFHGFFDGSDWSITDDPSWQFTLIHFVDDFTTPSTPIAEWCSVTQSGNTDYYHFTADGHVTRNKQGTNFKGSAGPRDRGYWFLQGSTIFVFWPAVGQVVNISLARLSTNGGKEIDVTIDDKLGKLQPVSGD